MTLSNSSPSVPTSTVGQTPAPSSAASTASKLQLDARVPANRYWIFGLLLTSALVIDLYSKWWVFKELGGPFRQSQWAFRSPFLWGKLDVTLFTSLNQGALWGLGQGWGWLFALLSICASALVVYWLFVKGAAQSLWLTISLAFVGSGALGNLYDRLYLHGLKDARGTPLFGVRDFLKFDIPGIGYQRPFTFWLIPQWEFPIFNLADSFLVTGAIMLVLHAMFVREPAGHTQDAGSGIHTAPGLAGSTPVATR